jgi:hypothetical protein
MSFRAAFVAVALCVAPLAHASDDVAAKQADIRKLLVLTGSAQIGAQVMTQMMASLKQAMPQVPERFWHDFQNEVKTDELRELIVPIYDKHLSHDDVKNLIKFYETPTGKHFISEMPGITQESITAGQAWGQAIGRRVMEKLQQESAAQKNAPASRDGTKQK